MSTPRGGGDKWLIYTMFHVYKYVYKFLEATCKNTKKILSKDFCTKKVSKVKCETLVFFARFSFFFL